jgi:DNA polymerase-3 subunit epsilon
MGRHGVYYQQTISRAGQDRSHASPGRPGPRPQPSPADDVVLDDVTGATTFELAAASPSDLVNQVNEAAGHASLLPLVVLLYVLVVTIPLAVVVRARDKARRTVVAFYQVEDRPAQKFQALADSFGALRECSAHWYVVAQGQVRTTQQYKTHAGASTVLRRIRGKADFAGPPVLATNIAVPSLHGRQRSVYFLPDRILVRDGKRYADLPYPACRTAARPTRFIEEGSVPPDAVRVDTTWKYVNKSGGPDRRYKNNRQLPILQYGELTLSSPSGFSFTWQTSRPGAVQAAATALTMIKSDHATRD